LRGITGIILGSVILIYLISIFLLKLPFFQVKKVEVRGLYEDELSIVEKNVHALGRTLILMPESTFLNLINEDLENRFKSIEIKRDFSTEGVTLKINFQRRNGIAKVNLKEKVMLIDNEGNLFKDEHQSPKKSLFVSSEEVVKVFKDKLLNLLKYGNEVKVKDDKVVLKIQDKKAILPPLDSLSYEKIQLVENLSKDYPNAKIFDIRYKDFILLK